MLLALLLVARAAAEWVEITQQHYRKPVRITTGIDPTRNTYPDLQNPQSYEHQTHIDQIFQTQMRDSFLQNIQTPLRKYQEHDLQEGVQQPIRKHFHNRSESNPKPALLNPFLQEDISAQSPVRNTKIDRVSSPTRDIHLNKNIGITTEDIYLNSSYIENKWDQNIHRGNAKFVTSVSSFDKWNVNAPKPNERNDKPVERRKFKGDNNVPNAARGKDETVAGKIERVPNIGSVKRVQLENTPVKSPALNNDNPKNDNRRNSQHGYGAHSYDNFSDELNLETSIFNSHANSDSKKPPNHFKQEPSRTEEIKHENSGNSKRPLTSFKRHPFTHNPSSVTGEVSKVIQGNAKFNHNGDVSKNTDGGHQDVINASSNDPAELLEEITASEDILLNPVNKNEKIKISNMKTGEDLEMYRESVKMDNSAEEEFSSERKGNVKKPSSAIKVNTIENILKFMKVVADTISKNTRRGKSKITYLNELKHTLMVNIKNRIDAAWPDDETSSSGRRHSRSASLARGHVEFPSSESALMTISFLTFAVFLIKLVLQVIQTYKHKAMVMAPLMLATAGRAASKTMREN